MKKLSRRCTFSTLTVLAAATTPVVHAQTLRNWTGLGTDNLWTNLANWDTAVPGGSDTASFAGSGNNNTVISLGGATQNVASIQFVTATAGYTLGVLGSGDTFNMASGGAIVVGPNFVEPMVVNANITTNGNFTLGNNVNNNTGTTGLTIAGNIFMNGGGLLSVSNYQLRGTILVSGNISDSPANPGSLAIMSTPTTGTGVNNYIITGNNTYSGTTLISTFTGTGSNQGSIQIGTDSAFGTGKVSIVLHGNAPQWSSFGGNHTVKNNFDLNGGFVFVGTNSLLFTGAMNVINSTAGGTRALNSIMGPGGVVYFGTNGNSSVINIGNPIANGGDGVGKGVLFATSPNGGSIVSYDILQDPGAGGGTSSGTVNVQNGGRVDLYGQSTYTGTTTFTGNSTIIGIGSSTITSGTSIISGPFGVGTIIPNQSSGQHLRPLGGNQTVANPITMSSGLEMDNQSGDSSNLTLSGPISVGGGNLIQNGFGGTTATFGTFILGNATAASTITIPASGLVKFAALAGPVVVNDVVQDLGGSSVSVNPNAGDNGVVTFAAANTYSGATTIGGGTLSISADNNLGNSANTVSIGAGSLLSTGSFTTSRSFGLTDTAASTLDASNGNTFVLNGAITAAGAINKGSGLGTVQLAQNGFAATSDVNVQGGTLAFGTASNGVTGPVNIPGTLNVSNGALASFVPATGTAITHTITNLNLNTAGKLDVGNSSFLTNSNVQPYLAAGYNNGAWNGSGAAIISTSANTAPGTAARSLGFASSADQAAGRVSNTVPTIASGSTLVKYTTPGDADLSGKSDFNDFLAMQNNFNKAGNWTQGDFDYNGTTNFNDFLILQNNFNRGLNANGTTAGGTVAHSAVSKLTASPAAVTPSVTYILSKNDDGKGNLTPGKYAVYAVDSSADGNQGVASFSVDVQGASLVTNFAPQGTFDKGQGNGSTVVEGFTLLRSVSGAFSTGTDPVKGSQDTVDDQSGVVLIYGMGQVAGNLNTKAPSGSTGGSGKVQASYGSPLLISTGTFASGLAFNSDQTFDKANVFLTNTAADTEAAGITLLTQDLSVGVPEPTTLGVIALGAGSLLARRKRRK